MSTVSFRTEKSVIFNTNVLLDLVLKNDCISKF